MMSVTARARFLTLVAILFPASLTLAGLGGHLSLVLALFYDTLSLLAFCVYAWDKRAARSGRRRVAEHKLHLLGLAGGWPGALAGQQLLRHKTQKRTFQRVFWLTVMANCALLAFALGVHGR